MKKILQNKYLIIELSVILMISFLYNLIITPLNYDEIWNYGFAYNISTGLIPYKDFNMVITPLFPFLGSIFMVIFGKNIVVYHIFNSFICTLIFYLIKKQVPRGYYIVYAFLILFSLPNYSLFCVLLLYLLMILEDKKSNDYLVGVVLGLTFLTKQNIGIMLCIPTLFTKDIKKIIKRIIGFLIPNIIFLIYLLISDTLYEFLDYCLFGLSSFAKENLVISDFIKLTIVAIIYLIYKYIKINDIKILYLLCFQILALPLFDTYHVMLSFLPVLGYFLSGLKLKVNITRIAFIIFISIISMNRLKYYVEDIIFYPNNTTVYKYRNLNKNIEKEIIKISDYIVENKDKIFIVNDLAYLLKLEANLKLTKYDLLNDGNLGKNGHLKIIEGIDEFCNSNECIILMCKKEINNNTLSQTNQDIITHVANTYKEIGKISIFTIYGNEGRNEEE